VCTIYSATPWLRDYAEIPSSFISRPIVYRQTTAGYYTSAAYVYCNVLTLLPQALTADFIYGTILYWLTVRRRGDLRCPLW
jgi:hypothetical protein